jgi:hypothetical protein
MTETYCGSIKGEYLTEDKLCYVSGMFIPDPDFYPSRIPGPKTATKERGEENLLAYLFCSHKFNKIENYFIFEMLKKTMCSNFQRIIELFTQNFLPIPDPGAEKAPNPGSGSATLLKSNMERNWRQLVHTPGTREIAQN